MTVHPPLYPLQTLRDRIEDWSPKRRAVCCSNCLHCVISGDPASPVASCAAGYSDKRIHLDRLIQATRPKVFRAAATCPGFTSMSDPK